jgi:hypothetical protein
MAFAGDDHVVVAVGTDLDGTVEFLGGNGRNRRKLVGLGFLAAKAAAHAPHMHRHGVRYRAQRVRHHVLHFARVLGRGPDGDLVILAGNGKGDMAFEIEMILPANAHLALEPERRCRKPGLDIAALELQRAGHQRIIRVHRRANIGDMRQILIGDHGELGRAPRLIAGLGNHGKHRLAVKQHLVSCQDWLVSGTVG